MNKGQKITRIWWLNVTSDPKRQHDDLKFLAEVAVSILYFVTFCLFFNLAHAVCVSNKFL